METTIVCYRMDCKHNERHVCGLAVVAIDSCGCCDYEEKDIYKEVEGFSRESESDI